MAPVVVGGEVDGGWILEGIQIRKSWVVYTLSRGEEAYTMVLSPPHRQLPGGLLARSPSFVISRRGEPEGEALAALQALAQRVRANDQGTFWGACAVEQQGPGGPGWLLWGNQMLLVLLVLMALFCRRGLASQIRGQGRWTWVVLLALAVVALVIRALLPPHAPLHANTHGLREMRELISGQGALIPNLLVGQYGLGKQALLGPLVALLGGTAGALFWLNITLGSLTVPALGLATSLLTGSRLAGVLAALILACLPAHVRLSASESGLVAYNLLLCLTLVAALVAARESKWRYFILAALLAGFTAQLHLVAVAAPVLMFMAALQAPASSRPPNATWRATWFRALAALTLAGVVTLPHALRMALAHGDSGRAGGLLVPLEVWASDSNLLFNPAASPILLTLCCLAGLALLARRRWVVALAWCLALAALSWLHLAVCACFSDAVRYQTTTLILAIPPAALALASLAGRAGARSGPRIALAGAATLAVLGSAAPGLLLISRPDNQALEYAFIREAMPKLPQQATLVLLDERLASRKVLTDFPDFLLQEHGKRWEVVRQGELDRRRGGLRGPLILYHGLTCHSFTEEEMGGGAVEPQKIRPECSRFRRRHELKAITEVRHQTRRPRWSRRRWDFHLLPSETLTLGFYLLELRP